MFGENVNGVLIVSCGVRCGGFNFSGFLERLEWGVDFTKGLRVMAVAPLWLP